MEQEKRMNETEYKKMTQKQQDDLISLYKNIISSLQDLIAYSHAQTKYPFSTKELENTKKAVPHPVWNKFQTIADFASIRESYLSQKEEYCKDFLQECQCFLEKLQDSDDMGFLTNLEAYAFWINRCLDLGIEIPESLL